MNLFNTLPLPSELIEHILNFHNLSPTPCPHCLRWQPVNSCDYCSQVCCLQCQTICDWGCCGMCPGCLSKQQSCITRKSCNWLSAVACSRDKDYCLPDCTQQMCGHILAQMCVGCGQEFCCKHSVEMPSHHAPFYYCHSCLSKVQTLLSTINCHTPAASCSSTCQQQQ